MLTREALLNPKKIKIVKVPLNDKDKTRYVYVKEMSGTERDEFEKLLVKTEIVEDDVKVTNTFENMRGKLCVMSICDKEGNLILKPEDWKSLSDSLRATEIDRVFAKSQELNKVSEKDKEKLLKN